MTTRLHQAPSSPGQDAVRIFAANERLNQILIERLDPVWSARPLGGVRTIAAIFAHVHNVRVKWIRLSAPHLGVPPPLDRARCTPRQARQALAGSAVRCGQMLAEALDDSAAGARTFRRDGWAAPWPAGPEMLCYMLAHEAHHRGQVCMLAHQLGVRLPGAVTSRLWSWERLWKEIEPPAVSPRSDRTRPARSAGRRPSDRGSRTSRRRPSHAR